jgi:hypothetical protein
VTETSSVPAAELIDTGPICYTAFDGKRLVWRPCRTWRTTAGHFVSVVTEIGDDGPSVANAAEKVYAVLQGVRPGCRVFEHYSGATSDTYDEILPEPDSGREVTWRRIPSADLRALLGDTLDATRPTSPVTDGVWH